MQHVPAGNPFSSSPAAAIANCCPGLEVDFRAVWRRILKGITLREYDNLVLGGATVAGSRPGRPSAAGDQRRADDGDDGRAVAGRSRGRDAARQRGQSRPRSFTPEWSNELARLLKDSQGKTVTCIFTADAVWGTVGGSRWTGAAAATYADHARARGAHVLRGDTAFISTPARACPASSPRVCARPGRTTFASARATTGRRRVRTSSTSRPRPTGRSTGDNWLQKERTGTYVPDDYVDERLLLYDELIGRLGTLAPLPGAAGATPTRPAPRARIRHDHCAGGHADAAVRRAASRRVRRAIPTRS